MAQSRSAGFDTLKGLLIFLVVFGHLLEPQVGGGPNYLYLMIYSFHMPAFVFLSGWFSRNSTLKKNLTGVLLPYLVFQVIYLLYAGLPVQIHSPYWILWYLFALFLWRLPAPLFRRFPALVWSLIPVSAAVSLLCGYTDRIGYDFALSRVLVFLPCFLLGFVLSGRRDSFLPLLRTPLSRGLSLAGILVWAGYFWRVRLTFQRPWFFGAASYQASGSSPGLRLLLLAAALTWIWFLLSWTPRRRVPGLTTLGGATLFVYLLHGFVKLRVDAHAEALYRFGTVPNLLLALLLAALLCAVFGNRWLTGAWRWLRLAGKSLLEQTLRR